LCPGNFVFDSPLGAGLGEVRKRKTESGKWKTEDFNFSSSFLYLKVDYKNLQKM
jgi:hypothetical protein